jgi:hypothetical protein
MKTTSPLVSSGLFISDPDGKDVFALVFLLNKLSVLYPMQSKG